MCTRGSFRREGSPVSCSCWARKLSVLSGMYFAVCFILKGLYPGYIIFFVQSALMIAGSKVIYRWQQSLGPSSGLLKKTLVLANLTYTVLTLSYSCIGFMVLSLHETLASYGSVYYIGTVIPLVLLLLGNIIKPSRSKAPKEQ